MALCIITPAFQQEIKKESAITESISTSYLHELIDYFNNQKKSLERAPTHNSYLLSCFSWFLGKGTVHAEEIEILQSLSNTDFETIAKTLDQNSINNTAQDFFNTYKSIKSSQSKWHDLLYQKLCDLNSHTLGYTVKSRSAVLSTMAKSKDTPVVKKAFIFGIAVTFEVEKLMAGKK
jgi:hypothetical protein